MNNNNFVLWFLGIILFINSSIIWLISNLYYLKNDNLYTMFMIIFGFSTFSLFLFGVSVILDKINNRSVKK